MKTETTRPGPARASRTSRGPQLILALLMLTAAACTNWEDNTPRCIQGQDTEICFCSDGRQSMRECSPSGTSLATCRCEPDAGAEAATDASSEVSSDAGPGFVGDAG